MTHQKNARSHASIIGWCTLESPMSVSTPAYLEIIDFIASSNPEAVARFRPSREASKDWRSSSIATRLQTCLPTKRRSWTTASS